MTDWRQEYVNLLYFRLREEDSSVGGWMEPGEGKMLIALASNLPEGSTIVEIGSFFGKSSRYLLGGATVSGSTLYCIDPFVVSRGMLTKSEENLCVLDVLLASGGDTLSVFVNNMIDSFKSSAPLSRLNVWRASSKEAEEKWDKDLKIDLLYIDGNHAECMDDLERWIPHLSDGGRILLHDVYSEYGERGPNPSANYLLKSGWGARVCEDYVQPSLALFDRSLVRNEKVTGFAVKEKRGPWGRGDGGEDGVRGKEEAAEEGRKVEEAV